MANYTLDHKKKAIVVTSEFYDKTQNIMSKEAGEMAKLNELFPNYTLRVKRSKSQGRSTPSYSEIEKALSEDGRHEELTEFLDLRDKKTNYFKVLEWYNQIKK